MNRIESKRNRSLALHSEWGQFKILNNKSLKQKYILSKTKYKTNLNKFIAWARSHLTQSKRDWKLFWPPARRLVLQFPTSDRTARLAGSTVVSVTKWYEILFALQNSKSTQIFASCNHRKQLDYGNLESRLSVFLSETSRKEKAAKEDLPVG